MNTPTKFEIKTGAGRTAMIYWFYIFPPAGLLFFISIFLFEPIFDMSPSSSETFMFIFLYVMPSLIALLPALFIYGFVSKRMQRKYLKDKIAGIECIINNDKDSIQSFKKSMDHHAQEQLGCIELELKARKLYNEKLKGELINSMRSSAKEFESFSKERVDSLDDENVIGKLELESTANDILLSADDLTLDGISELNKNFKNIEDQHKKLSEQTINHYNKSSEEWKEKMIPKIKENEKALMLYSAWLEAI
jgi:hypothetical protein